MSWAIERDSVGDEVVAAFEAIVAERDTTLHVAELDVGFHRALVEASDSRFLLQAWLGIAPIVQALISIGNRRLALEDSLANYERIVASHRPIMEAFITADVEETARLLQGQFDFTKQLVLRRDLNMEQSVTG